MKMQYSHFEKIEEKKNFFEALFVIDPTYTCWSTYQFKRIV